MLVAAATALALLLPQGEQDRPVGMTVVVVDVGQGDGTVVRAPDGTIHVFDAGPPGQGTASVLPVINSLQSTGYGYTFLSHFHDDHQGGMDEVLARPFLLAHDRGDLRRTNTSADTNGYLTAAGNRRRTLQAGQVLQLGGGATVRCVAVNGVVDGGGGADPVVSAQEENSRSVALRLEYRNFSMWIGGDLTGGGNSTADVESDAALACGDVDIYKLNHHGSNTSTNTNLVSRLAPEVAVVSCGLGNSFGHPTTTVVNRLVQATAMRSLLSTTRGSANVIGFAVTGSIRIDTDGMRYRVAGTGGSFLDFWTDEVASSALAPGEVRISEVHRNPSVVPDTNGEYVELTNTGGRPLALRGMRLTSNSGTVTLASNLMLVPGRPALVQVDGDAGRNGGQPLGLVLPFQTIALGDTADSLTVQSGTTSVDSVTWGTGFPGGVGVSAEKRALTQSNSTANWGSAGVTFGAGDRGSPGARNPVDSTTWPVLVDAAARPGELVLRGTAVAAPAGSYSALGIAFSSSPGFPFLGAVIPLNYDLLLQSFLGFPGAIALMPAGGYRSVSLPLPQPNPLQGVGIVAAHVVFQPGTSSVVGISSPLSLTLP